MNDYIKTFFDVPISQQTIDSILKTCKHETNERYTYFLYTLWLLGEDFIIQAYINQGLVGYIRSSIRILDRMPFLPEYNDFELHDFLKSRDDKINFDLYRSIQCRKNTKLDHDVRKFVYQFIIQLKIRQGIPVAFQTE